MGDGQDVLDPRAVGDGTLDQLGTSVLLTAPAYLVTARPGEPGPAPGPPGTGQRDVARGQHATWYFATPLAVSRLEVPGRGRPAGRGGRDPDRAHAARTARPAGSRPRAADGSRLAISLPAPGDAAVAVVRPGGRASQAISARCRWPTSGRQTCSWPTGSSQNALVPPRWGYAGHDGSFAVFVDHFARRPLSLAGAPRRDQRPGAVGAARPARRRAGGGRCSPRTASGWSARWRPSRAGPPPGSPSAAGRSALAVGRAGLVQAVDVPPGRGMLTWSYVPPVVHGRLRPVPRGGRAHPAARGLAAAAPDDRPPRAGPGGRRR